MDANIQNIEIKSKDIQIPLTAFEELLAIGLSPVPIFYNTETKIVDKYPLHSKMEGKKATINDVRRWITELDGKVNGIALKLYPPFGMLDFDLKNTDNKDVFDHWYKSMEAISPGILDKVCIERTRSGGYHIYIKYAGLSEGRKLASHKKTDTAKGGEVIALYTGGGLSFCDPTPDYKIFKGDLHDLDFLTPDEFDILCTCAMSFDEYHHQIEASNIIIDYPIEYENLCSQFDQCNFDTFNTLLESVGLIFKKSKNGKFPHEQYLREGSDAPYSAKVYRNNHCCIFSGSMPQFPTWKDRIDKEDHSWILTPSRIVYYKNNQDWPAAMAEIKTICESAGIDIKPPEPDVPVNEADFPFNVFPEFIEHYISHSLANLRPFLAGGILVAASAAIGNSCVLMVKDRRVTASLYLAVVASPGGGKSPALRKAFAPLEKIDKIFYDRFKNEYREYKEAEAARKRDKNAGSSPEPPALKQTLIKDATIETVVKILSHNPIGCTVFADELSGFLMRMDQYKKGGDEVQKWLAMWSNDPVLLQRIGREENKVSDPFCSIIGGIQPGILEQLSANGKDHNGFYHRFLFIYPEDGPNPPWNEITHNEQLDQEYELFISDLCSIRNEPRIYRLSDEANEAFGKWYDSINAAWLTTKDENLKGVLSKLKDYYCLRLALLLTVMEKNDPECIVDLGMMNKAIRLTAYFLGQIKKAMKKLSPASPVDGLSEDRRKLYEELPENFSLKTAFLLGEKLKYESKSIRNFIDQYTFRAKERLFEGNAKEGFRKMYL